MAKYLVFSDSHSRDEKMLDIIKRHKEAEGIFFLGDIENYGDRLRNSIPGAVYMVREIVTGHWMRRIFWCFSCMDTASP